MTEMLILKSAASRGDFGGSHHDPWLTPKDENVGHVFNVTTLITCRHATSVTYEADQADFIRAGASAVGVGSAMINQRLLDSGGFATLTDRARQPMEEVARGRTHN